MNSMRRVLKDLALLACALALVTGCRKREKPVAADSAAVMTPVAAEPSPGASLDCAQASSEIEKLVCGDPKLSALDQRLGTVYKEAEARQGSPAPSSFIAAQRGWIRGRDDCGRSTNPRACVDSAYTLRIAELQATNLLVPTRGPVTYVCANPGGVHDEISAMFAETNPRSVVLERGDKSIVAYVVRSGGGVMYAGANVTFREKGGTAQVTWLGTTLKCREQAPSS